MKNEYNLVKILKDEPKGTKLYCPVVGTVTLQAISESDEADYVIFTRDATGASIDFTAYGHYYTADCTDNTDECILFPDKDFRSWANWEDFKARRAEYENRYPTDKERIYSMLKSSDGYQNFWDEYNLQYFLDAAYFVWKQNDKQVEDENTTRRFAIGAATTSCEIVQTYCVDRNYRYSFRSKKLAQKFLTAFNKELHRYFGFDQEK